MTLRVIHWSSLQPRERAAALQRPVPAQAVSIDADVASIIHDVRVHGDAALLGFAERYDGVKLGALSVTDDEWERAESEVAPEAREALVVAVANVRRFHEAQRFVPVAMETSPGIFCERVERPIRAVGLYVPAGSAPLPSAAIMSAVPAQIMGCPVRVMCSPPNANGRIHPAVLLVARMCGISQVYKAGGAQAVAAMAYGTASIPKVDKVFGPGNAWVTAAKQQISQDPNGAALDLPAGPSEVLVIADHTARPDFVASDLLAQAEHDPRSHVVLVTTSAALAEATEREVRAQCARLTRREIAERALQESRIIVVDDLRAAFEVSNAYAPEHLVIDVQNARSWLPHVQTAGSVFLGPWTCEPLGDYCSGTNHVLPTYGYARAYSGLSLDDFGRRMTVQEASPAGLRTLGPTAHTLAMLEGLDGHARAVSIRLDALHTETLP